MLAPWSYYNLHSVPMMAPGTLNLHSFYPQHSLQLSLNLSPPQLLSLHLLDLEALKSAIIRVLLLFLLLIYHPESHFQ